MFQISRSFAAILAKKLDLATYQDASSGKKKQQINPKENFRPVSDEISVSKLELLLKFFL